jgi:signal transduction histidine kinase
VTLRNRLILVFLALTLGATSLAGALAYRSAVDSVKAVARRTVGILAQDRRQALVQRLQRQHRRAEHFLHETPVCTRLPLDAAACRKAVRAFAVEEELLAVEVVEGERAVVSIRTASDSSATSHPALFTGIPVVRAGQLARFALDTAGFAYYDIAIPGKVDIGGATPDLRARTADWLLLRYALRAQDPLFGTGSALGQGGESFLADATGHPLTPLRYPLGPGSNGVISSAPMHDCLAGHDGEVVDADYRGTLIIHGYRFVPEIGGGCIMAHVSERESTAPVLEIRNRLLSIGLLLALIAIAVSIFLARDIAAPLTQLVRRAEAVTRGDEPERMVEDGVPEVRALSRAFATMTDAIAKRTDEREFALAARARFYHAMSHELRTPLNAIVGYLDLLRSDIYGVLPAPAHEAIGRTQRASYLLRDLIDDVLDLAKIEAGRIDVRREPVRLAALLDDLRATLEPLAATAGVTLVRDCAEDFMLDTDARRARQILLNLVSNAIKFGPDAPVVVRCHRAADGAAIVDVIDHGPGIAPADQDRIFDEYVQLPAERSMGTGLGLAISRRLAVALGGSLAVESVAGQGATFRLRLP